MLAPTFAYLRGAGKAQFTFTSRETSGDVDGTVKEVDALGILLSDFQTVGPEGEDEPGPSGPVLWIPCSAVAFTRGGSAETEPDAAALLSSKPSCDGLVGKKVQVALSNKKLEDLVGFVKAIDQHGVVLTEFVTVDETGGVVVGPAQMTFIPMAGVVYIWPTDDDEGEEADGAAAKKARTE